MNPLERLFRWAFAAEWERREQQHQETMSALATLTEAVAGLTGSVQNLTTKVDAAIADIQAIGPTDAQLATLADALVNLQGTLDAQAERLQAAVDASAATPTDPGV